MASGSSSSIFSSACRAFLPLNPQGLPACPPDSVVQYGGQFCHQHQLAGVWRRDNDELSDADDRPHRPELRLCGNGHGGSGAVHPWPRSPLGTDARQLLGRPDTQHRSTSSCRCRSFSRSSSSRRASCRPSPDMRRSSSWTRSRDAQGQTSHGTGDRRRPCGIADSDQATRHQWRRLLQRELGPPVRESDAVLESVWSCCRSS